MTVCGRLATIVCSFVFSVLMAFPSSAQTSSIPESGGWWTALLGGGRAYYSSPGAACKRQHDEFGTEGTAYRGSGPFGTNVLAQKCDWTNHVDRTGPLTPLPSVVQYSCPSGSTRLAQNDPRCEPAPQTVCDPCNATKTGNPITVEQGGKYERVVDYASADGRFKIVRYFNSRPWGVTNDLGPTAPTFGPNWRFGSLPQLWLGNRGSSSADSSVIMPSGQAYRARSLNGDGSSWDTDSLSAGTDGQNSQWKLESLDGPISSPSTYLQQTGRFLFTDNRGVEYTMQTVSTGNLNRLGLPVSVLYPGGYKQFFTYTDDNRIETMRDNLGRTATFTWNAFQLSTLDENGNPVPYETINGVYPLRYQGIAKIEISDGTVLEYDYDLGTPDGQPDAPFVYYNFKDRLIGFKRLAPGNIEVDSATYHYEDARHPYLMTGVTDDALIRYNTWEYDALGRAVSSSLPGGVNRTNVTYQDTSSQLFRTVTNAMGRETDYTYNRILSSSSANAQLIRTDGAVTTNVPADFEVQQYPGLRSPATRTIDKEGRITEKTFDQYDRVLTETYAVGTSDQFTNSYTWHPRFMDLPETITQPGQTTSYEYNELGQAIRVTETDTTANPAPPRVWSFIYAGPNPTIINGPLASDDVITMSWENDRLLEVTNEVGHVTQITEHAGNGAPRRIIDPNNVETVLSYDGKYRLTRISRSGAVTDIEYTPTDLVSKITLPNQSSLTFLYDPARRLMGIRNAENEQINYTRNLLGGIESTTVSDGTAAIHYEMAAAFDEINRVIEATGVNSLTKFGYDKEDNLTNITDPRGNDWTQSFDNLDRLKSELNPLGGTVDYQMDSQMDARNPLTAVTDERSITTTYIRNGYGEVTAEISAERGTTTYARDAAGRITRMTDARGVISDYVYDDADRLLSVTYPDSPVDNITYAYDQGDFGIGELTAITESFGTTTYAYDSLGHMVAMSRTINGVSYDCLYEYDLAGEVTAMVYPSGTRIEYSRDAAARIISISMTATDGTVTELASGISYKPFGPVEAMTYGDGHVLSVDYDLNYRATNLRRAKDGFFLINTDFTYDPASDITAINDNARPERTQGFGYDALSRLTSADGAYGSIQYGYNAGGDRTSRDWSKTDGTLLSEDYTYEAATARLLGVSLDDGAGNMTPIRDFTYNASGQVVSDNRSGNIYDYGMNARGRMTTVTLSGVEIAAYTYDESEQRIIKAANGKTTHYHYDLEGRLIAETDGTTGETLREYIWLGLMPIAVIAPDPGSGSGTGGECNPTLIEALEAELAASTAAATALQTQILDWDGNIAFREAKIAEMRAQLDGLSGKKREQLEAKIAKWESLISSTTAKVTEAEAELAAINATITDIQTALAEQQAICDGTVTGTEAGTFYLHADHLGRPQFATDSDGAIVWDMGEGVTPFGQGVNLAGAFAQRLMFPGQYADEETGEDVVLSHNWHRTYDPTLGRYLQSDPIGLAGGLNRYAYVGGNPMGRIDPDGLQTLGFNFNFDAFFIFGGSLEFGFFINIDPLDCNYGNFGLYGAGKLGVGFDLSVGGGAEVGFGTPEQLYDGGFVEAEGSILTYTGNASYSPFDSKAERQHAGTLGGGLEFGLPVGLNAGVGASKIIWQSNTRDHCECEEQK